MKSKFRISLAAKTCKRTWDSYIKRHSVEDRDRSGRPPKCSVKVCRAIRKFALANRFSPLKHICNHILNTFGISLSRTTARGILKTFGLARRVAVRKPLLTDSARERRLVWSREHKRWNVAQWRRVIFSDEKIFRIANHRRSVFVTRSTSEKYDRKCIRARPKYGAQVHVWGVVGWNGVGPLKLVRGSLTGKKYREEIINDLQAFGPNLIPPYRKFIFQQDLAPPHSARDTQQFFTDNHIRVLPWPSNSPDLNIIENVWSDVVRRVECSTLPKSNEEFWERVEMAWSGTSIESIRRLIKSMPNRVKEVIKAKGGNTRY